MLAAGATNSMGYYLFTDRSDFITPEIIVIPPGMVL
jgi:hypothetical protein